MKRFENRTALVTGGAGFIGSHLVDALLREGARVRVLDNFETGHRQNLAHHGAEVEVVEGDICDLETCQRAVQGSELVFHQAALGSVPRSLEVPSKTFQSNVLGTANVFTAARDQGVKRVVYASSSSVFGNSQELPKREGQEGKPLSPYAMSKWMNEELAQVYWDCFELEPVGLRYFNIYGPRQDPNGPYAAVIPRFFDACKQGSAMVINGDGEQSRDFTFVEDAVEANLLASLAGAEVAGEAFNIGAEAQTTVNRLAAIICEVAGAELSPEYRPPRPGDVRHSNADVSKARSMFGYSPKVPIEEGLRRTRSHYLGTAA